MIPELAKLVIIHKKPVTFEVIEIETGGNFNHKFHQNSSRWIQIRHIEGLRVNVFGDVPTQTSFVVRYGSSYTNDTKYFWSSYEGTVPKIRFDCTLTVARASFLRSQMKTHKNA